MAKEKSHKQIALDRMFNVLKGQGMFITESTMLTPEEKIEEFDVVYVLTKFLEDFDENKGVLDKYWRKKREQEKLNKCLGRDIDE